MDYIIQYLLNKNLKLKKYMYFSNKHNLEVNYKQR